MSRIFRSKALTAEQAVQAFPLVRTMWPALTLDHWTNYVRSVTAPDGNSPDGTQGIISIENERGYIHGLFSYGVTHDVRHGSVLSIEDVIALDLVEGKSAIRALVETMEEVARDLGCRAIHVHMPEALMRSVATCVADSANRHWLLDSFERAGHRIETLCLCKRVSPLT